MIRLVYLLILLCSSLARAATVDDLPSDHTYKLAAIEIDGVGYWTARSLRGVMLSNPPPWYKPWQWWFHDQTFNAEIFRTDLERIATYLREHGYYRATVAHEVVTEGDELRTIIHVDRQEPARVESIDLVAVDFALAEVESDLRDTLTLETGGIFTQADYDQSRQRLERYFLEHGFAYTAVAKAAVVDVSRDQVAVTYTITRSRPAVFGTTAIAGYEKVDEELIRRELTYEAGEPYDPRKLEETQANLIGLDLFRSVVIEPTNLAEHSGVADIAVRVAEGPPRSIRIGLGYGLEDGVRGQLQWQHNNLFGGGRRFGARIKGSFIEQTVEGEFRQPFFLHPRQNLVIPLTQIRLEEPGYTLWQVRLAPRVERDFKHDVHVSFGYGIEYDDVQDVPEETQERLDDYEDHGFLSGFTLTVERKTTRDLLDPHQGSVVTVLLEQAGGPWQGAFTFYRALLDAKKYFPLPGERVLATRIRIGGGDGFGQSKDLPIFRRFYAGGINSTRGYGRSELGPLTSNEKPIGGRSLFEGSIELRTPIYAGLGAVAFFDVGAVNEEPFHYRFSDFRYSVGPGLRYATPVGPIRVDIGFPLNAPKSLPGWQIHFSIGQAF